MTRLTQFGSAAAHQTISRLVLVPGLHVRAFNKPINRQNARRRIGQSRHVGTRQNKLLYIRLGMLQGNRNNSRDQYKGKSSHNSIAIIPLPLRVTAMGNDGDYHDDDIVRSSCQIWDDLRPMQ